MIAYVLLRVFLILLLVAANAFFAAAEFSLVSVRECQEHSTLAGMRDVSPRGTRLSAALSKKPARSPLCMANAGSGARPQDERKTAQNNEINALMPKNLLSVKRFGLSR